jgi:hypothetical protein
MNNELMSKTAAELFQREHDASARTLTRMTKTALRSRFINDLAEDGMQSLSVNNYSKDELISAILNLSFPIAKLNEAIHVRYHDEWKNDACDYCRAETAMIDPAAQPPF